MNIGIAIRNIRKKIGITQYEFAGKCEISSTSLSQIENGVKHPSTRTIKKMCEVLEIPESVVYILAMQETDVPGKRRRAYEMLFPIIRNMALQIIGSDHDEIINEC